MLCISNCQGDTNQNSHAMSHTIEIGTGQKEQDQPVLAWVQRERDSPSLLLGWLTGPGFLENYVDVAKKFRN